MAMTWESYGIHTGYLPQQLKRSALRATPQILLGIYCIGVEFKHEIYVYILYIYIYI